MRVLLAASAAAVLVVAAMSAQSCGGSGQPTAPATTDLRAAEHATATGTPRRGRGPAPTPESLDVRVDDATSGPPPVDVTERPEPMVSGVVQTADGTPVPDALVALGDLDSDCVTTTTTADGRFKFDDYPFYSTVYAFARHGDEVWRGKTDADGFNLNLNITVAPVRRADRTVLVRVLDCDGRPVPRARVRPISGVARPRRAGGDGAVQTAGGWFSVSARTWRSGERPSFLVSDLRDTDGRALALAPTVVTVDPSGDAYVETRLRRGIVVKGRVESSDGSPRSADSVRFVDSPLGFDMPVEDTTTTDERGQFWFSADLGAVVRVLPSAGEHAGSAQARIDGGAGDVVLRVRPVAALRVFVLDAASAPVVAAVVAASATSEPPLSATTALDGSCVIVGVPAGVPLDVSVGAAGFVPAVVRDGRATDKATSIVLEREAVIRGRIEAPDGSIVVGLPVEVLHRNEPTTVEWCGDEFVIHGLPAGAEVEIGLLEPTTSLDRMVVDLPRGWGRLKILAETHVVAGAGDVVLRWGSAKTGATLIVSDWPPGATVDVLVTDGDQFWLEYQTEGPILTLPDLSRSPKPAVQIGPTSDGRFARLDPAPAHGFTRVRLQAGATLRGTVVFPEGVEPHFVACSASTKDGFVHGFETAADGSFEVVGLPPGAVHLTAWASDTSSGSTDVDLPADDVKVVLRQR